eukprot:CAMPEP_0119545714 /NCGR_PEP_ID=MMETSP1352-20130426/385_1 /TAXON_ID=265584 /ORGANISM="Stauroneis constricta, Strain CCMP1120" /LENGTH=555 /DNA_ID=CAMNT_0007590301 /DNA_START=140 /DNA_END=1807 /DNA_ORIENTATION=+
MSKQLRKKSSQKLPLRTILIVLAFGVCCFYGGLLVGFASAPPPVQCPEPTIQIIEKPVPAKGAPAAQAKIFPESVDRLVHDYATVSRSEFNQHLDIGVPYDEDMHGSSEVVVLYTSDTVLPKSYANQQSATFKRDGLSFEEATSQCDTVKVVLTEPAKRKQANKRECVALVPQWESYYVHKFMRLPPHGQLQHDAPLRYVSRSHVAKGVSNRVPVMESETMPYYPVLMDYLSNLDRMLKELRPIADGIVGHNRKAPIVVLVCNWGQAGLFHNFVCNAKSKGLDVSNLLIFATDEKTKELAESLGVAAYYDEGIFGDMPEQAARAYGDRTFARMMMAKVFCVHLISSLGHNLIFQDVDVVWFKSPVEYFSDSSNIGEWDIMFQDDGAHSVRYSPYSPNTGFYYVKANDKTRFFFSELLRAGDVIAATKSHQAALTAKLNEHASWKGLRVKVWNRGEDNPFPGGFEYHRKKDIMKSIFNGNPKTEPYIFHMSWTENKNNKKLYFEQMGEWYIKDGCTDGAFDCCLAEPDIKCHYRDKPSKIPCKDSPPIDKGRPSFW